MRVAIYARVSRRHRVAYVGEVPTDWTRDLHLKRHHNTASELIEPNPSQGARPASIGTYRNLREPAVDQRENSGPRVRTRVRTTLQS